MENPGPVDTPLDHKTRPNNVSNDRADAEEDQISNDTEDAKDRVKRYTSRWSEVSRTHHSMNSVRLSQHLIRPYKTTAKRVLRYLKRTADARLVLFRPQQLRICTYSERTECSAGLVGYADPYAASAGNKYDQKP